MSISSGSQRRRAARLPGAAALAAVTLLALLAAPAGAVHPAPHLVRTSEAPYSSYSSGRVNILLPSAFPDVELVDAQNASVGAGLSVDQILEVAAGSSPAQVVAVAFPSQLHSFNGSASGGSSTFPLSLTATLQVFPASANLWAGPDATVTANGPPLGVALLAINYSVPASPSPSTGVAIGWTVTDWPWLAASDLLGVQLGLTTEGGHGLTACSASVTGDTAARCPGTPLGSGSMVWGPSFLGLEGESSSGPVASVAWGSTVTTASGGSAPVTAGAFGQSSSYGHLFIGGAASSSAFVHGSISFALVHPSFPVAPIVLRGELGWFAASAATCAAAGLVALVAYRRHNRAVERSL